MSVWIENLGNGKFLSHELPVEAQIAPINTIECLDIDEDGNIDLLIGGNEYQAEVSAGRFDASYGLLLKGLGKGKLMAISPVKSGFILDGNIKHIRKIHNQAGKISILVGINNDSLRVFH